MAVTVSLASLLGLPDEPATLAGWRLRREPDGRCRWTSASGQVHRVPEPLPG